jgi:lipopolysaccharide export system permease protein
LLSNPALATGALRTTQDARRLAVPSEAARVLTFDRYLLRSFWHIFAVCFITTFGLIVVIDLLENLDDFLARNGDGGPVQLVRNVVQFYGYKAIFIFDQAGPSLTVVAAMLVLVLFQRSGELHPLLAAGVPMYRVLLPLVGAALCVSAVLTANQELVIPQIAHAAFDNRGGAEWSGLRVEPVYDYGTRIQIDGRRLQLAERTIEDALFVLPAPALAAELTILKSKRAWHRSAKAGRPAGWLLRNVEPHWDELPLTDAGRAVVLPGDRPDEIFVVTAVTCDQLYKRSSSYAQLSTRELLQRIHSPAFGMESVHQMVVHLHARLMQPLLNVIAVFIVIPLMVRRESPGLVIDSALCAGVLIVLFGLMQACLYAGQARWAAPDVAAWTPVVIGGTLAAWYSGVIRT